ncbi:MAG: hypothetical protein ACKOCW_06985, partial [Planctomycetaceae bacterium]
MPCSSPSAVLVLATLLTVAARLPAWADEAGSGTAAPSHAEADSAEHLKLLVRPLTKEELEEAAGVWRDRLKQKVAEISALSLSNKQANAEAAEAAKETPSEAAEVREKVQETVQEDAVT